MFSQCQNKTSTRNKLPNKLLLPLAQKSGWHRPQQKCGVRPPPAIVVHTASPEDP